MSSACAADGRHGALDVPLDDVNIRIRNRRWLRPRVTHVADFGELDAEPKPSERI
jgi:hypothetical protein